MLIPRVCNSRISSNCKILLRRCHIQYTQGQSPEPRIREYFYYIDHQGMLFLDDARIKNFTSCFKDKKFLAFFFTRLKLNDTGRYPTFPFLSVCGRERNYVRCDDCPIVFTSVVNGSVPQEDLFCYNHADSLLNFPFQPSRIFMQPQNGRIYHPGPKNGGGVGLVSSKLAIEISKLFSFDDTGMPTHFNWKNQTYCLENDWFVEVKR